jgi:hypothetical protein
LNPRPQARRCRPVASSWRPTSASATGRTRPWRECRGVAARGKGLRGIFMRARTRSGSGRRPPLAWRRNKRARRRREVSRPYPAPVPEAHPRSAREDRPRRSGRVPPRPCGREADRRGQVDNRRGRARCRAPRCTWSLGGVCPPRLEAGWAATPECAAEVPGRAAVGPAARATRRLATRPRAVPGSAIGHAPGQLATCSRPYRTSVRLPAGRRRPAGLRRRRAARRAGPAGCRRAIWTARCFPCEAFCWAGVGAALAAGREGLEPWVRTKVRTSASVAAATAPTAPTVA